MGIDSKEINQPECDANDLKNAVCLATEGLVAFYQCMWYYIILGGSFVDCPYFPDSRETRCHLYSLTLIMRLWDKAHYKNNQSTFGEEMIKNLRSNNIVIPGTSIPLNFFCYSWLFNGVTSLFCIFVLYPLVALLVALYSEANSRNVDEVCTAFVEQLLHPQDWLNFSARSTCLTGLHAHVTKEGCYHWRSLGCASYPRTSVGDEVVDWSVQHGIEQNDSVLQLFGEAAPLTTLRIVSARRAFSSDADDYDSDIQCLSAVLVCGRSGQMTALEYMKCLSSPFKARRGAELHAVRFCVDMESGRVGCGSTSSHLHCGDNSSSSKSPRSGITQHPDTSATITGLCLPAMGRVLAAVEEAHRNLAPGVPLVGWDVALTAQQGYLMEGSFSCELLKGCFDHDVYYRFLEDHFLDLNLEV